MGQKQPRITLVEMPAITSAGEIDKFDVYSKFRLPPRATGYLHAILLKEGYRDVVNIAPHLNPISGKLTEADKKRIEESDYLLLSAITRTITQTEQLARQFLNWNPEGKVILGGPHATFASEECLKWADIIVRGEGDKTLPELMEALKYAELPKGVRGVSYKKGREVVYEPPRPFLTAAEFSKLPPPFYDSEMKKNIGINTLITSRGCPFDCSFCSVTAFYGRGYRRRSNDVIFKELLNYSDQPQKHIFLADDNFGVNSKETKDLLRSMIEAGINKRGYSVQLRVDSAFDEEFLKLLRQAGVNTVYVGIESINDETLKQYNKKSTSQRNKEAVKRFREAGLWVHGMMIVGGDGDTQNTLRETLEWAKANLDSVQFFTHMLLPGTVFTRQMEEEGRIIVKDSRFYDGHHVLMRPKNLTPYQLQLAIFDMYKQFYSVWDIGHILRSKMRKIDAGIRLYARFRLGLNNIDKDPQMISYLKRLQRFN